MEGEEPPGDAHLYLSHLLSLPRFWHYSCSLRWAGQVCFEDMNGFSPSFLQQEAAMMATTYLAHSFCHSSVHVHERCWIFIQPAGFIKISVVGCQAPLSMGFPRQGYWSGLPFPSIGDLPDPRIAPGSLTLQADSLPAEPPGRPNQFPWNSLILYRIFQPILELSTLFRINKNRVYGKIIDAFMSSEGNTSLLAHRI